MPDSSTIEAQLNQLQQGYLHRLPKKLDEIVACWQQLSSHWYPETLNTLHRLVHTLAGSSATFGLMSLSETALKLEQSLQLYSTQSTPILPADRQPIIALLIRLQQQIVEVDNAIAASKPQWGGNGLIESVTPENSRLQPIQRQVFLVEDDPDVLRELALQISYFGYDVRTFGRLEQLKTAIAKNPPAAIIMDIVFPKGDLAGTVIAELNQWRNSYQSCYSIKSIPVIFMSIRDDLLARLQAVRAGGEAYFTKPININQLIDKLDRLTQKTQPAPYRILIVEDDRELAEFHALTLQQSGMVTQIVTHPMEVMSPLSEFKPDLILMDVYMPSCSGLELAAVVRQQSVYVSIPIVFLSTETNLTKQLAAMSLGGDDFLTKPIRPEHLISSVASRAHRSAMLRSVMVRDSLTGLFNHTKTKEQLAIELKRAKRQHSSLAFTMVDIDLFKSVNDTYGHLTGDRVIKSLARLLQQWLRETDVIGRYGGEEFAIILVDTDANAAVEVMNQLRQSFAQVQQRADDVEFNVTFSCGIAVFPAYADVAQLCNAADRALYQAKRNGRNQIVLALD